MLHFKMCKTSQKIVKGRKNKSSQSYRKKCRKKLPPLESLKSEWALIAGFFYVFYATIFGPKQQVLINSHG